MKNTKDKIIERIRFIVHSFFVKNKYIELIKKIRLLAKNHKPKTLKLATNL